jgi:hypothetical protein
VQNLRVKFWLAAALLASPLQSQIGPPPPAKFLFTRPVYYVSELQKEAQIDIMMIVQERGLTECIHYSTVETGSATASVNFVQTQGRLCFDGMSGSQQRSFAIPLLLNPAFDDEKTFQVKIESESGDANIPENTAEIRIIDAAAGRISFASENYFTREQDGKAQINLVRTGGTKGKLSVVIWLQPAYGVVGAAGFDDFAPGQNSTVTFEDGEIAKTHELTLIQNDTLEGREWIDLGLSDDHDGALIDQGKARLFIDDTVLEISRQADALVISWPPCSGCKLESADDLTTGNWIEVQTDASNKYQVHSNGASRFYRLREL